MGHVALTSGGRYLHLCEHDGETRVCAGAETIANEGVFERRELSHGRIALRTLDGRYLCMRPDRGQNFGLYADDELTPSAAFEEILWPDGRVSLRSCELTYVGAQDAEGMPVTVNRTRPAPSERFWYVEVPVASVPRQRDGSERPAPVTDTAAR